MALLTYNPVTPDGLGLKAAMSGADAIGDTFPIDANKLFAVFNGDTGPHTVTIAAPVASTVCGNYGSLPVEDLVITVAADEVQLITIPLGYGANGVFTLTYDAVTGMTVGGYSLAVNG